MQHFHNSNNLNPLHTHLITILSATIMLVFLLGTHGGINAAHCGSNTAVSSPVNSSASPSIFFCIDHSGSMCVSNIAGEPPLDSNGYRFSVVRTLIDSICRYRPHSKIGLAVFRQYLYFNRSPSHPLFASTPEDTGAYIPLLTLDSTYMGSSMKGSAILQEYLKTEEIVDTLISKTKPFVGLAYKPDNDSPIPNLPSTNINTAFNAAKHAMAGSKNPKEHQFVIFISDGEATYPTGPTRRDFEKGVNVPTTFTVFFSVNGSAPMSLNVMTNNIQANRYSSSNPKSRIWPFNNTSFEELQGFLMNNAIRPIFAIVDQVTKSENPAPEGFNTIKAAIRIYSGSAAVILDGCKDAGTGRICSLDGRTIATFAIRQGASTITISGAAVPRVMLLDCIVGS
ncbi:MAG: hypothetical protein JW795_18265, partial [Chitinivibrionales bacterium]|nr:hypothetical protein [Chitinivibrionales bacterium]